MICFVQPCHEEMVRGAVRCGGEDHVGPDRDVKDWEERCVWGGGGYTCRSEIGQKPVLSLKVVGFGVASSSRRGG